MRTVWTSRATGEVRPLWGTWERTKQRRTYSDVATQHTPHTDSRNSRPADTHNSRADKHQRCNHKGGSEAAVADNEQTRTDGEW